MNLGNVIYYMWGYREVAPIFSKGCCCCDKDSSVSDIGKLNYDPATGEFSMVFVRDGKIETATTKIIATPSDECVTDINSMKLDSKNNLTLTYVKNGENKNVTVNLESLEDDIFIEELGDNLI